jgi:site-specific DNA recombinase
MELYNKPICLRIGGLYVLVAAYLRVSTDEQVQGFSLDSQRERLEAFALSQSWKISQFYKDDGYSAKDLNRPAMQELITDAQAKKFDAVIFYRLDRFSRSAVDVLRLVDEVFDPNGLILRSVTEPFDTSTNAGRMMLTMLVAFSQYERESIAERTKVNLRYKAARGEWCGGTPPYGYLIGDNKRLVLDPEKAPIVKRIFLEWNGGRSLLQISQILRNIKAPTARNGRWGNWQVSTILRSYTYTGNLVYGRWNGSGKGRKFSDKDTWTIAFRSHEPIIDEDTFNMAQIKLLEIDKIYKQKKCKNYLFAGRVYCGICGMKYGSTNFKSGPTGERIRIYYTRKHGDEHGCPNGSIKASVLEEQFIARFLSSSGDLEARERFLAEIGAEQGIDKINDEITKSEELLQRLNSKRTRWLNAYGEGFINVIDLKRRLEEVNKEIDELNSDIDRLRSNLVIAEEENGNFDDVIESHWLSMSIDGKYRIARTLVQRIEIYPGNVAKFFWF